MDLSVSQEQLVLEDGLGLNKCPCVFCEARTPWKVMH